MIRISALAAFLALAACAETPAVPVAEAPAAAPQRQCTSFQQLRARFPADTRSLHVEDTAGFMRAFNAWKEPTDYAADDVYVLRNGDEALAILMVGGCAIGMSPMSWQDAEQMISGTGA